MDEKIKMEVDVQRGGNVDWIDLALERDKWWAFVCAIMNLRFQ